jgi:hypothetical protein
LLALDGISRRFKASRQTNWIIAPLFPDLPCWFKKDLLTLRFGYVVLFIIFHDQLFLHVPIWQNFFPIFGASNANVKTGCANDKPRKIRWTFMNTPMVAESTLLAGRAR